MEDPNTLLSIAITEIPEKCFLGVVPGVLRCGLINQEGFIPGPEGAWLDTNEAKYSLAKITLGSAEETNTVLVWDFAGAVYARKWNTYHLVAYRSRPIGIFHKLVRWNQDVAINHELV